MAGRGIILLAGIVAALLLVPPASAGIDDWPESVSLERGSSSCHRDGAGLGLEGRYCEFNFYEQRPKGVLLVDWFQISYASKRPGPCLTDLKGHMGVNGGRILARAPYDQPHGERLRTQLRIRSRADEFLGRVRAFARRDVGRLVTSVTRKHGTHRLQWKWEGPPTRRPVRLVFGVANRVPEPEDGLIGTSYGGTLGTGPCRHRASASSRARLEPAETTVRRKVPLQFEREPLAP